MTSGYARGQLRWPNIVRAVGHALAFAPLTAVATARIEKENAGSASALVNMMRNLGGMVGIFPVGIFPARRCAILCRELAAARRAGASAARTGTASRSVDTVEPEDVVTPALEIDVKA